MSKISFFEPNNSISKIPSPSPDRVAVKTPYLFPKWRNRQITKSRNSKKSKKYLILNEANSISKNVTKSGCFSNICRLSTSEKYSSRLLSNLPELGTNVFCSLPFGFSTSCSIVHALALSSKTSKSSVSKRKNYVNKQMTKTSK